MAPGWLGSEARGPGTRTGAAACSRSSVWLPAVECLLVPPRLFWALPRRPPANLCSLLPEARHTFELSRAVPLVSALLHIPDHAHTLPVGVRHRGLHPRPPRRHRSPKNRPLHSRGHRRRYCREHSHFPRAQLPETCAPTARTGTRSRCTGTTTSSTHPFRRTLSTAGELPSRGSPCLRCLDPFRRGPRNRASPGACAGRGRRAAATRQEMALFPQTDEPLPREGGGQSASRQHACAHACRHRTRAD